MDLYSTGYCLFYIKKWAINQNYRSIYNNNNLKCYVKIGISISFTNINPKKKEVL